MKIKSDLALIKSKIKDAWIPPAYNKRDILQINGDVTTWNEEDIRNQLEHNRILQDGFPTRDPQQIIADMKLTKQAWLTDFICPRLEHLIRMHIAARVATSYKVTPDYFEEITQRIYRTINNRFHQDAQQQITSKMAPLRAMGQDEWLSIYQNQKNRDGSPKFGNKLELVNGQLSLEGQQLLQALIRMKLDVEQRQIADKIINTKLKLHFYHLEHQEHPIITPKKIGDNNINQMILGAAGSGKSSILKHKKIDLRNAIAVSTDNYRAVQFGNVDATLSNEQVYIKTQDTAYMIKERVAAIMKNEIMKSTHRPRIILDVVSIEPWMSDIVARSKTEVAIACLGTAKEIAPRAWKRAEDPNSSSADRNRHVNTELLIKGHSFGSNILASVPKHRNIALYNTNTADRVPVKIAILNTVANKMQIVNLSQIGQFLGKKNLNVESTSEATLFYNNELQTERFQYTARHQAECILALLKPNSNPRAQGPLNSISLQKNGHEYAKIQKNQQGQIKFVLTDLDTLERALNNKKDEALIHELQLQTSVHNENRSYLGNKVAYEKVMEDAVNQYEQAHQAPTIGPRN